MILARTCLLSLLVLAVMACRKPAPPDTDKPPDPQAPARSTELRDAVKAPIDRAEATEAAVLEAAAAQRAQIEAQAGG